MKYTFSTDCEEEARRLFMASECHFALSDMRELLRGMRKYGDEGEWTDDMESIWDQFHAILGVRGIEL